MKYGVLTFSYAHAKNFERSVAEHGFFSMNLGDYMQTLAVRRLYQEFGIPEDQTVGIDRDTLASYRGEPVILVMNAVFFPWSFPLPDSIIPVFTGFQASEKVIKDNLDYFRKHAPIGCRDLDTTERLRGFGVEAFTTGCLTMTFARRDKPPTEGKTFIISGGGAGAFPGEVMRFIPTDLLRSVEFVFQRKIVHRFPLTDADMRDAERYTAYLLNEYRERASLVVTPLHHATTPCVSSGIPTIVCRKGNDTRFSFLSELMPIYTPERFADIVWDAPPADIEAARAALIEQVRSSIERASNR
jgi:hypothetical protein